MSKTARILLGVLASLGVAGLTLGLLVVLNQPEQAPPASAPPTAQPPPAPKDPNPPQPADEGPAPPDLEGLKEPEAGPVATIRRTRRLAQPKARPADVPAPPAEPADTEPPKLTILTPRGHAVVMTPKLLLRVRSEAGARVTAGDKVLSENSPGLFAIDLQLDKGRNQLTVIASDAAGNQRKALVRATFIDPARFEKNKAGFVHLLEQLDEVRSAAAELDRRISELVAQLDDATHTDQISQLSRELREIRSSRSQIETEVGRAIQEIDTLLASGH